MDAESEARPRKHHHLGIYDTDGFFVRTVVEHVRRTLAEEATAVALSPSKHHEAITEGLAAAGIDVTAAGQTGRFVIVASEGLVMELTAGGAVDRTSFGALAGHLLGSAATPGGTLRICGDVHSALWQHGDLGSALEMEDLWNALPATPGFELLCLYASSVFHDGGTDDPFFALLQRHIALDPVENYASLVDPTVPHRTVALLEHQQHAGNRERRDLTDRLREVEAALDAAIRDATEQRAQFEQAVASRDVIGQAKGIVMVRWHIDADTAFEMLRSAARRSRRKLRDVAQSVVEQQIRRN